jgi:hypothetical protein
MSTHFSHYPSKPTSPACQSSFTILCNAHDTATSFLETFIAVRKARAAKGAPTDEEQDLLRACLVFAGAGLDSMAKQLIRDALPVVIERHTGAHTMLKQHVERHVLRDLGADSVGILADLFVDPEPRTRLIERLVNDLTSGSLQSAEELMRVGAYFDIPSRDIVADARDLQSIFAARNQIVHEMDVDFAQVNRNRRSRTKAWMTTATNEIFRVSAAFLAGVDTRAVQ